MKDLIAHGPTHLSTHLGEAHHQSCATRDHAAEDAFAAALVCLKSAIELEFEQHVCPFYLLLLGVTMHA